MTTQPSVNREQLITLLEERAELLALPDDIIRTALVRCIPRPGLSGNRPASGAVPLSSPLSSPIPTQVANAATEIGEDINQGISPSAANKPDVENITAHDLSANEQTVHTERVELVHALNKADNSGVIEKVTEHDQETLKIDADISSITLTPRAVTATALEKLDQTSESARVDALAAGTIIAGYRIEAPLGAGAMGQVYRALQLSMNREVAFKVLAPKLAQNRKFRERFLREARAAGRLHHPNLIAVHDVGEADGRMFFSMELVDGITVGQLLKKHGRIPEMRALEIIRQCLDALKFAHGQGVVHRDIKPDNIMVKNSGMVKVADLGLARAEEYDQGDASITQTSTNMVMGTPHYMAPEQGRDAHRVDHRADLYAVGATLYHMLCGEPPFSGDSAMEVLLRAASKPLKFPEPGPTPALRVLISRLMEKDPAKRPQSASDVLEMISKLRRKQVEDEPEMVGDAATAVARARSRRIRRTVKKISFYALSLSIAVVILLFILGISGGWQWRAMINQTSELAAAHKYAEAIAQIDRQDTTWAWRQNELQRLRSDIINAWDSWSYVQAQKPLRLFQEHLNAHRLGEAYTTLQSLSVELRSPKVQKDVEQFQRQWEEAMLEEESKENQTKNDDNRTRMLWPSEYMNHLGHDLLEQLNFSPKENAIINENSVRFIQSGQSNIQGYPKALEQRLLRLQFRFHEVDSADDSVRIIISPKCTITFTRHQIMVSGNGGAEKKFTQLERPYTASIRNDRKGVELQIGENTAWEQIADLTESFNVEWRIGAQRTIEIRARIVPARANKNKASK
jgi:serine/threonine protein kinase